jgi:hypothetical protein
MNCEACCENLTALLDGELSRADTDAVRSHVDACRGCREELQDLEHASALVESRARGLDPAPALWSAVEARITAPASSRPGFFDALRAFRWLPVTAAIAATLAIGVGVSGYLARQEAAREEQEARALERYMDEYVARRQSEELEHVGPPAVPLTTAAAPAANPIRLPRAAHREYSDNPFVVADDSSASSPFQTDETTATPVEAK